MAALTSLIQFPWRYYLDHPELITLLGAENLHKAKHLRASGGANQFFSPAIGVLDGVLRSGVEGGLFRVDLDTVDIYMAIMSLGYFYVSNRHTLSQFLGKGTDGPRLHRSLGRVHHRPDPRRRTPAARAAEPQRGEVAAARPCRSPPRLNARCPGIEAFKSGKPADDQKGWPIALRRIQGFPQFEVAATGSQSVH